MLPPMTTYRVSCLTPRQPDPTFSIHGEVGAGLIRSGLSQVEAFQFLIGEGCDIEESADALRRVFAAKHAGAIRFLHPMS